MSQGCALGSLCIFTAAATTPLCTVGFIVSIFSSDFSSSAPSFSPSPFFFSSCLTYQCFWWVFRALKLNFTLFRGQIDILFNLKAEKVNEYELTSEGKAVGVA